MCQHFLLVTISPHGTARQSIATPAPRVIAARYRRALSHRASKRFRDFNTSRAIPGVL
jgi:hypothetical protein